MADWLKMVFPFVGAYRLHKQLSTAEPKPLLVLYPGARFRVRQVNGAATDWRYCVAAVRREGLTVYPRTRTNQEKRGFDAAALRWFGRPEKYHDGFNDIWLEFEQDSAWLRLEIRIHKYEMHDLVRAMKAMTDETLIKAYRRQRPYVHYGPITAYPATQDIHGAWKLADAVSLYVTPLHLLILDDAKVLRAVPLTDVQQIMALPRLDAPDEDGLVRFRVAEESMAFAIEQHQLFADKLAEAARRSLEEPLLRKQKGYDEEWE